MDNKLTNLIKHYHESIQSAVKIMKRSGIRMPSSSLDWIEMDIPFRGKLEGGIEYLKHGVGCLVFLKAGEVDFDFGEHGEIGGINTWWLSNFAKGRLDNYGFSCKNEIEAYIQCALDTGELEISPSGLCYVANAPRMYATDIDCTLVNDKLPDKNLDRVFTLQSHYFQTAVVMFEQYEKLRKKKKKYSILNQRDSVDLGIYLCTWLGFLAVTCEGFKKLKMYILLENERPESFKELIPLSNSLSKVIKKHSDPLRKLRNNIFHLRENSEVIRQFFIHEDNRLIWAKELHMLFEGFFSQYRILSEVHYVINNRKGESSLIKSNS